MPKRTNWFQQVVTLIHEQLAEGAVVTESKMLTDLETGADREVDVVIEQEVAGSKITIGVECTDLNHPATVEWVERMSGKHSKLPTDRLILLSRSGYTSNAQLKAAARRIEALTLDQAADIGWDALIHKVPRFFVADARLNVTKYFARWDEGEEPPSEPLREPYYLQVGEAPPIPILMLVKLHLSAWLERAPMTVTETKGQFNYTIGWNYPAYMVDEEGRRRKIRNLMVSFDYELIETESHELEYGHLRDVAVAYGQGDTELGNVKMVLIEREGQPSSGKLVLERAGEKEELALIEDPDQRAILEEILREELKTMQSKEMRE